MRIEVTAGWVSWANTYLLWNKTGSSGSHSRQSYSHFHDSINILIADQPSVSETSETSVKTILQTCDNWDTDYNSYNWEPEFMTIFVTWQSRVTLDSIRNSCDVFFQWACRIILGPQKHVLQLVWSAYVLSTAIRTALKIARGSQIMGKRRAVL